MLPYLAHPGICGGLHVAWLEIPGNMEAAALRVNLQSAFVVRVVRVLRWAACCTRPACCAYRVRFARTVCLLYSKLRLI